MHTSSLRQAPRALLLSLMLLLAACQPAPTQTRIQGSTMGTYYAVTLSDPFPGGQGALQQEVETLLARLNQEISTYDPASLISRFNQGTGQPPQVIPATMARIVQQGMDAGRLTRGALDVTVGPLVNLWGFGPDKRPTQRPGAEQIAQARARVGIDKLSLTPQGDHFLLGKAIPGLYLDLSTLGEGAASDEIAGLLERRGVHNYLIEVAGAVRSKGRNAKGNPWRVAIVEPSDRPGAIEDVVTPNGMAVSTAGSYRNYYELDGKRYSHIIDPATGEPVTHRLVSASVITPTALEADALDTALMVMGPERAMAFAKEHRLAVYLIEKTDQGFVARHTPEFAPYLVRSEP
ncbi:FAD:protein FMN transferase [Aeromonas caviae]|uniref:FAD:protein FMN transferase n=1 Tax=Aeromonas caviae TaxID=648 RepID=UPI001906937A|nr:FAD:protein FMN transferase [Aeromonas caviae]MBL0497458.1 FAD:protein FMN transferase [Aeromonas caviae]MDX7595851.1 FAD:protein FMN transferase [Aeromonas caviae]QQM77165.1 FAD:protein FMN transferase [Aeromonas caviae]QQV17858.1 FAD:protein FMN transferase [Aeromonas caviae]WGY74206.1 FAD:protein FMN transferase [Aeromonas caviae]